MAIGKKGKSLIDSITSTSTRINAFTQQATSMDSATFREKALKLGLELIMVGEFIKTTLIMDSMPATIAKAAPKTNKIDPKLLEGASDEEKAAVEQAEPQ